MKNIKLIFTVFLFSLSFFGFSQKIKLKKGHVLVDEVVWLKYNESNGSFNTSLINFKNEEIIFIKFVKRGYDNTIYNKTGEPNYFEVIFLGLNKKIEIKDDTKEIIKIIFNSKAVNEDGTLNKEKVERLVEKYGTEFSDRIK